MALRAVNILVAGITNLVPLFTEFIGVGIENIGWVRQVVTYAIIAKTLSMALITIQFFSIGDIAMFHGPAKFSMGWGSRPNDDGSINEQIVASANDGNGMT